MAQFFKAAKTKQTRPTFQTMDLSVQHVDHHGKGICLEHDPIIVVPNASLNERYKVQVTEKKKRVWFASIVKVLEPNEQRIAPFCPHYTQCGGCVQQAFSAQYQFKHKEMGLQSFLNKHIDAALIGDARWYASPSSTATNQPVGYRRKARLSVDARNLDDVKIGYRAHKSNQVINIRQCEILDTAIQACLFDCLALLRTHPLIKLLGHITVLSHRGEVTLCLHFSKPLKNPQLSSLEVLEAHTSVNWLFHLHDKQGNKSYLDYTQAIKLVGHTLDDAHIGVKKEDALTISDADDINVSLLPHHFIQINQSVNQDMLATAKAWLAPNESDVLVDLYAGLGNFALHLSHAFKRVVAVEGVSEMVQWGRKNAARNHFTNIEFITCDLNDHKAVESLNLREHSMCIIDPSRDGALALMPIISKLDFARILYVSCNPSSFVRDVAALGSNYRISKLQALDMFPYTEHIELMALIEPKL